MDVEIWRHGAEPTGPCRTRVPPPVRVNSIAELELQLNSNSNSEIGIEIGGIENGIQIENCGVCAFECSVEAGLTQFRVTGKHTYLLAGGKYTRSEAF